MRNTGFLAGQYIVINSFTQKLTLYQGYKKIHSCTVQMARTGPTVGQYHINAKTYHSSGGGELKLSSRENQPSLSLCGKGTADSRQLLRIKNKIIWLNNDDLKQIFTKVSIGTPVIIKAERPAAAPPKQEYPFTAQHADRQSINQLTVQQDNKPPLEEITPPMSATQSPVADQFIPAEIVPDYTATENDADIKVAADSELNEVNEGVAESSEVSENKEIADSGKAAGPEQTKAAGFYYTVIPGDSLWRIARRFNLPMQLIMAENNLDNPNRIFPGQKIFIPYS